MKIGSMGSCLSSMLIRKIMQRFGGQHLFHIARHRSDQFYYYYVAKDKDIVPRSYIEDNLNVLIEKSEDPNFVSLDEMLNDQYEKIGQYGVSHNKRLFEVLMNEKLDIIVLDNFLDIGTFLSYPKLDGYEKSPVLLRKKDFSNYDDYFTNDGKLPPGKSAFYFQEIIKYLKYLQPDASIYFVHYPYNTYDNNLERQIRAREFEDLFHTDIATIIPAPYISKSFQIKNDPAHFDDSIYTALGGFVYFHYKACVKQEKNRVLLQKGKRFNSPEDYFQIPLIAFNSDSSWSIAIKIYEFKNDELFNFFLGKRGVCNLSILRRKNLLEFRADDGTYVGGVEFCHEVLNHVVVVYDKGSFTFYNNGNVSTDIYHSTSASFDAIGSGYDGKSHEYPCQIFQVSFWDKALEQEEFSFCFDEQFIEKTANLIGHWDFGSKEKEC